MSRLWRTNVRRRKVENRAVFCWTRNLNYMLYFFDIWLGYIRLLIKAQFKEKRFIWSSDQTKSKLSLLHCSTDSCVVLQWKLWKSWEVWSSQNLAFPNSECCAGVRSSRLWQLWKLLDKTTLVIVPATDVRKKRKKGNIRMPYCRNGQSSDLVTKLCLSPPVRT